MVPEEVPPHTKVWGPQLSKCLILILPKASYTSLYQPKEEKNPHLKLN